MNILDASFDDRDIERYCIGAGIIPISVSPTDNTPHLLLGREQWVSSWKGSCRWSGFEGSRKECESTRMSAAREFVEESMGCVHACPRECPYDRIRDVIHSLETRRFWKRIVLKIETERNIERYHTTFLIPVPWNDSTPQHFFDTRMEVEQVERLVQEWNYTRPYDIGEAGENIGPIVIENGTIHVEKAIDTSPCITRRPWRRDGTVLRATFTDPKNVRDIEQWSNVRDRLTRAVKRCTHPCVRADYDDHWRIIQRVHVNTDYLEKDQVRWWSIDELDAVIAGQGQLGMERFRPYFLPVLQTVLDLIHKRMTEVKWTPVCDVVQEFCIECEPPKPYLEVQGELAEPPHETVH